MRRTSNPKSLTPNPFGREGWEGWDEYAPFYDWENAQTLGRRDVPFWQRLALTARGRVLELGCGTGRVSKPLVKAGVDLIGIDRSAEMLRRINPQSIRPSTLREPQGRPEQGRGTIRSGRPERVEGRNPQFQIPNPQSRIPIVRGDIRTLPFGDRTFSMVIAPYGILQSLVREEDLAATLDSVGRVIDCGGTFGIDLVPDVPKWREYEHRVQLRGRVGRRHLTLIESVRQDRRRRLTTFAQCYVERRNGATTEHRFALTFRTLTVPQMTARLEHAGFVIDRILGDYRGQPWAARADVWIILARRRQ
jgi:SAM-dependent methyltransferase